MIPGTTAIQLLRGAGGGGSDESDDTGPQLDFVNDIYVDPDGNPLVLADVVNLTGRRSSSGLQCIANTPVLLINDWRDVLFATDDWTMSIEFEAGTSASGGQLYLMTIGNVDLFTQIALYTDGAGIAGITSALFEDDGNGITTRFVVNSVEATVPGFYKIAGSRTDDNLAVSFLGEAPSGDGVSSVNMPFAGWLHTPTKVEIANGSGGIGANSYIRKITIIRPSVENVDLDLLS